MTTKEERTLELNIVSASDLKRVKIFGKQNCFVVASICSSQKKSTQVDYVGGHNPSWNSKFTLTCDEGLFCHSGFHITVQIYSHSSLMNKFVGTVTIPLQDVPRHGRSGSSKPQVLTYQVRRRSGRIQGVLCMSVKLGEKKTISTLPPPRCYGKKQVGHDSGSGLPPYTPQSHYGYSSQQYYSYGSSKQLVIGNPSLGGVQQWRSPPR